MLNPAVLQRPPRINSQASFVARRRSPALVIGTERDVVSVTTVPAGLGQDRSRGLESYGRVLCQGPQPPGGTREGDDGTADENGGGER